MIHTTPYQVTEMKGSNRYWFNRDYLDTKHGRDRKVLVSLEKAGWQGPDLISGLPWNVAIEDRGIQQTWKLVLKKVNGEDKLVFERYSKTREGIKEEEFDLAFLPSWVNEEIAEVGKEMAHKDFDGGINFLNNLVKKIAQAKKVVMSGLSTKVEEKSIGGLYHIMTTTRGDERGSFREIARMPDIELLTGYDFVGKQVNHSLSTYGVLRGMHVEPWAKLVTTISGFAMSVFLDCRPKSKTFGKMETIFLGYGTTPDGEKIEGGAIFIEPGIANSLLVLSEKMDYQYVVDDLWRPDTALYSVSPMDPKLAIPWSKYVPAEKMILSERDRTAPTFEEFTEKMKA